VTLNRLGSGTVEEWSLVYEILAVEAGVC